MFTLARMKRQHFQAENFFRLEESLVSILGQKTPGNGARQHSLAVFEWLADSGAGLAQLQGSPQVHSWLGGQ